MVRIWRMGFGAMAAIHVKFVAAAALAATLGGCVTAGPYQVQNATGQPIPHHALADEVFLDGTGPSSRRLASAPRYPATERRYAAPAPAGAPTRAVVRTRPTAIERADSVSSSTTGTRNSVRDEPDKPFSEKWWENERREDARLKARMNICRGC